MQVAAVFDMHYLPLHVSVIGIALTMALSIPCGSKCLIPHLFLICKFECLVVEYLFSYRRKTLIFRHDIQHFCMNKSGDISLPCDLWRTFTCLPARLFFIAFQNVGSCVNKERKCFGQTFFFQIGYAQGIQHAYSQCRQQASAINLPSEICLFLLCLWGVLCP